VAYEMVKTTDNFFNVPSSYPFPVELPFDINVTAVDGQVFKDTIFNFDSGPTEGSHQFGDLGGKPTGENVVINDGDIVTPLSYLMLVTLFIVMSI
jgi:hypothetical protein